MSEETPKERTARVFPIEVAITAATGFFVCDSMQQVYEILNFLTSDRLMTHQLPRVLKECEPWVKRQCPRLADLDLSYMRTWHDLPSEAVRGRLRALQRVWRNEYGAHVELHPIPAEEHQRRDPVEELIDMANGKPVIVIIEGKNRDSEDSDAS